MRHVLVVEDDRSVCDILEQYLGSGGYRTTHAYNGDAALEALRQTPRPDAAIIDLLLPDTPGIELAQAAVDSRVPVLLMSGAMDQVIALRALNCPHLEKPFKLGELGRQLETLIAQREEQLMRITSAVAMMSEKLRSLSAAQAEMRETLAKSRFQRAQRRAREDDQS